jgi:D-sedoheptulose 7-phosphate isomerase
MEKNRQMISERIRESIQTKSLLLADQESMALIDLMASSICSCLKAGGRVLFAGNGGSFADSIHLAAELVSRFTLERDPLAAFALGANNSILTAIGNDYTFADVFVRELKALGRKGDVFIGLSTSGNSENIVRAVTAARDLGMVIYCWTGKSGGRLSDMCSCLKIPSEVTARIQEAHIMVGHIICELVERSLFMD